MTPEENAELNAAISTAANGTSFVDLVAASEGVRDEPVEPVVSEPGDVDQD